MQYQATNDTLRAQVSDRDNTIAKLHADAETARQAHLNEKEVMNLAHETNQRNHSQQMAAMNEAHTIRINEMLKKLSDLRIEKDSDIRNLEVKMAQERLVRDTKID
jgi:hypothetical protein